MLPDLPSDTQPFFAALKEQVPATNLDFLTRTLAYSQHKTGIDWSEVVVDVVNANLPVLLTALLSRGADPNARTAAGTDMLTVAASTVSTVDPLPILKALVAHGAKLMPDTGKSAMHELIGSRERWALPCVAYLIPHLSADERNISLAVAAYCGTSKVMELLLVAGADPNSEPGILHYAADRSYKAAVSLLLQWGANPNARNSYNATPYDAAITAEAHGCAELIDDRRRAHKIP